MWNSGIIGRFSYYFYSTTMKDRSSETVTLPPTVQKFERLQTIQKEHKDALERAVSLNVPHAVDSEDKEPSENNETEESNNGGKDITNSQSKSSGAKSNWDEVVEKLLKKHRQGDLDLEKDTNITQ
ncbi:unnamed protein product [Lupinus luteus]|uniref:Uncharacterized protein n=1 Tax=Lupinus luteus TaxID=3873 RepID=A0AAV1WVL4_LUPLU